MTLFSRFSRLLVVFVKVVDLMVNSVTEVSLKLLIRLLRETPVKKEDQILGEKTSTEKSEKVDIRQGFRMERKH